MYIVSLFDRNIGESSEKTFINVYSELVWTYNYNHARTRWNYNYGHLKTRFRIHVIGDDDKN